MSLFRAMLMENGTDIKMNKILRLNSELNKQKRLKVISIFVIFGIAILLIATFSEIWRNNLNLDNPLIPEKLKSQINAPYIAFGITVSISLILALILKLKNQNLLIIILGLMTIGIYYITDFPLK